MKEAIKDPVVACAAALLTHYSFDLGGSTAERLIIQWQKEYPGNWLRLAVIEALYQGRYKAVSVTQLLAMWKRRGELLYHFNYEFERLICRNFPLEIFTEDGGNSAVEKTQEEKTLETPVVVAEFVPEMREEFVLPSQNRIENSQAIPPWQPVGKQQKIEKVENERAEIRQPIEEVHVPVSEKAGEKEEVIITPINCFVPNAEISEFYSKLKAVAKPNEELYSLGGGVVSVEDVEEVQRDLWDE
ncbi:hypothetical protein NG798_17190 [Ancylothrix sp. C2]|uniref:hypothetical protein n=1 Tax=Ancylothrix sp. D3o TaxID=2953691 RepID=UPI0021BAE0DB|nr:hypothetical protein [Ancylothrix sp. D3o]MCT7951541.1 hypothetical protein [Ancylothrix sp. D3o]